MTIKLYASILKGAVQAKQGENGILILHQGRPESELGRLPKEIRVYDLLDRLHIAYERIDHEAANTMEACAEIDEALAPATICKNLFLVNSARTQYYLLLIRGDKKFKTAEVSKQIGSSRLSFGSAEKMEDYLDISPGSVSIMGLMNDHSKCLEVLVDGDVLRQEYFACHPCVNTSSIRMKTQDVFDTFLRDLGYQYRVVNIQTTGSC